MVLHGIMDGTNPIDRVRDDIKAAPTHCTLFHEVNDDHSLSSIVNTGLLCQSIHEIMDVAQRIKSTPSPVTTITTGSSSSSSSMAAAIVVPPKAGGALPRVNLLAQLRSAAKK
jgi:hypothetical protein